MNFIINLNSSMSIWSSYYLKKRKFFDKSAYLFFNTTSLAVYVNTILTGSLWNRQIFFKSTIAEKYSILIKLSSSLLKYFSSEKYCVNLIKSICLSFCKTNSIENFTLAIDHIERLKSTFTQKIRRLLEIFASEIKILFFINKIRFLTRPMLSRCIIYNLKTNYITKLVFKILTKFKYSNYLDFSGSDYEDLCFQRFFFLSFISSLYFVLIFKNCNTMIRFNNCSNRPSFIIIKKSFQLCVMRKLKDLLIIVFSNFDFFNITNVLSYYDVISLVHNYFVSSISRMLFIEKIGIFCENMFDKYFPNSRFIIINILLVSGILVLTCN